jgi:hypothetical protein
LGYSHSRRSRFLFFLATLVHLGREKVYFLLDAVELMQHALFESVIGGFGGLDGRFGHYLFLLNGTVRTIIRVGRLGVDGTRDTKLDWVTGSCMSSFSSPLAARDTLVIPYAIAGTVRPVRIAMQMYFWLRSGRRRWDHSIGGVDIVGDAYQLGLQRFLGRRILHYQLQYAQDDGDGKLFEDAHEVSLGVESIIVMVSLALDAIVPTT